MPLSFAHLWQNPEHSDVDVVLTAPTPHASDDVSDQERRSSKRLAAFPGHSVLLSSSPVISAQILRWQNHAAPPAEEPPAPKRRRTRSSSAASGNTNSDRSSSAEPSSRPQLVLELQDASHEAAAVAVLQSLYAVKPLPQLLEQQLPQEQQLTAAMLADLWQAPDVAAAAVRALSRSTLSDAVLRQFLQLQAVPTFLLSLLGPVVSACLGHKDAGISAGAKGLLLSVLGDLEEVLGDEVLRATLLKLQLPAMQLLLGLDELKVASEDTVLAAARAYMESRASSSQQATAPAHALGPLIRCQHLSLYWLSACVLSRQLQLRDMFRPFSKQLKKLLMMRLAHAGFTPTQEDVQEELQGAPASWLLGQRSLQDVQRVQLVWHISVSKLRQTAERSAQKQRLLTLRCPSMSAPFGGISWSMLLQADWSAEHQGVCLGLFCMPRNAPRDVWYRFAATFQVEGAPSLNCACHTPSVLGSKTGRGFSDVFELGWMAGGWDDSAWAAAGLPCEGELRITLTVNATNCAGDTYELASDDSESTDDSESGEDSE